MTEIDKTLAEQIDAADAEGLAVMRGNGFRLKGVAKHRNWHRKAPGRQGAPRAAAAALPPIRRFDTEPQS